MAEVSWALILALMNISHHHDGAPWMGMSMSKKTAETILENGRTASQ